MSQTLVPAKDLESTRLTLPPVFVNILHMAIENDSIDVLRICLKHGLNPNEPGTATTTTTSRPARNSNNKVNPKEIAKTDVAKTDRCRFPISCGFCAKGKSSAGKKTSILNIQLLSNYQLNMGY